VGSLINPAKAAREEMARLGIKQVDHSKRNRDAIRHIEAERLASDLAKEEAKNAELFKMERFKVAEPRLYEPNSIKAALAPEPRQNFLTRGSGGPIKREALPDPPEWAPLPESPQKPRVPLASETAPRAPLEEVDFISKNTMAAVRSEPRRADPRPVEGKHKDFAKIPSYLDARKAELAEIKRQQDSSLRKDHHDGMVLMPDHERLRTLDVLKSNHDALTIELGHFAIVCDTLSRKRRKDEIEAKLKEIESAIELFSKDKVWVTG